LRRRFAARRKSRRRRRRSRAGCARRADRRSRSDGLWRQRVRGRPRSAGDPQTQRRAAIARGERIFNNRPIPIIGVAGLNDVLGQPTIMGTCSTCHNTTAAGSHSLIRFVDLGLTNRRAPDQSLYTLERADGATRQTTDPGLALSTGKWDDIGKFKVPVLRALAMRAPYFHDGSARDLAAVVGFYDVRFRLQMNPGERADLVAFLQAL
jgi:cytochrome c peroxidase